MNFLDKYSLKKKLSLIIATTLGIALFLACFLFLTLDTYFSWKQILHKHTEMAKQAALNISTASVLDDRSLRQQVLNAFSVTPSIEAAYLYDMQGLVISKYVAAESIGSAPKHSSSLSDSTTASRSHFAITQPVYVNNKKIGQLVLDISAVAFYSHVLWALAIALSVYIIVFLLSFWLWKHLQKGLDEPIGQLNRLSQQMLKPHDFSSQIQISGNDEFAHLSHGFNIMLDELQKKDEELQTLKGNLEEKIKIGTEQAEAASHAKSNFLATMSHELRTPMNAVIGMAELLQYTELDAKQQRYAEIISHSGEQLLSIINDILDFSKIEAEKMDMEEIMFEPGQIVSELEQTFLIQAEQKELDFNISIDPEIHGFIMGDPFRLRQILVNLVSNAIKFTQQGSISVSLRTQGGGHDFINYYFEVKDTGIGLKKEKLAYLFSPFHQLDSSTTREYGGTGLGLAISQKIANMMGGEIQVESKENYGSRFFFTLPFKKVTAETLDNNEQLRELSSEVSSADLTENQYFNILITDDEPINQEVIKGILNNLGFQVDTADNGQEAFDIIRELGEDHYDLILMDIQMPGMDGYTTTRKLRQAGINIPIVALSAHASSQASQASLDSGMNGYLTKPVQMDKLNRTLSKFLGLNTLSSEFPFTPGEALGVTHTVSADKNDAASSTKNIDVMESLDQLTTVNLDEVLIRLNNNTDLLTRLLAKFYQTYKDFFQQINAEFNLSHYVETADLAHKLKGASRSLSFAEIAQQSEDLELALKDDNHEVLEILEALNSAIEHSMQELEEFLRNTGQL